MHAGGRAMGVVALTFSAGSNAVLQEKGACPQIQSWLSLSLSIAHFPPWRLSHQEGMIRLLLLHI